MSSPEQQVVVTGLGMVTPFGLGHETFWAGVSSSRSAARLLDDFDPEEYPTPFACPLDDRCFDPERFVKAPKSVKLMSRATRFAVAAGAMAVEDAGLDVGALDPYRAGVALGTGGVGLHDPDYLASLMAIAKELNGSNGNGGWPGAARRHLHPLTPLKALPNIAAAHIAINQGFRGENVTVCTACTSGTQAIGEALRILRRGQADVMLAGGTDAMLNPMGLIAFGLLSVLSTRRDDPARASRPFDRDRDGFVMGEGATLLLLETRDHAERRGAKPLAQVAGYGVCSDAYRITDEREDGDGCAEAMRRALADASVDPGDIDYVNAHGTGTRMNDKTEVHALRRVFGSRLDRIPVSSTKSQVGHLVAAAGAVEAGACILALGHQVLPPTINYDTPDPECDIDVVPNVPRAAPIRTVMSNSFGFGGQNACLVLKGLD